MKSSIYWYDFETTGTDAARDRAIQFAGVRTDLDLKVVGEPLELLCYPGDDVIPSPEAMLVTGIRMSALEQAGLRETDFTGEIHKVLSTPGTCGAGYNSIRFDDEFTRHLLYRNFFDPYAREWQGGNSRWDIIDVLRMAQALRPAGINWPTNEAGHPVFRLEALTAANNIPHADAHDAAADVRATVAMARLLKVAQPRLFDYLFELRNKKAVLAQLYPLGKKPVVHVSSMYSGARQYLAVVLPVCAHPTNSNGVICYDLSVDPGDLLTIGPEELARRLFTRQSELESDETRIALKTIHVNRSPAVAPLATLLASDAERLGIDLDLCHRHMRRLQQTSGVTEKIQDAHASATFPLTDDPDLMLYQGNFFSNHDRTLMQELRDLPPESLANQRWRFDDARLDEMVFRFRSRNYPETLSAPERARWETYRNEISLGGDRVRETLQRIDALLLEHPEADCLTDLAAYLHRRWPAA
ncbi:MAG: exodeoxyribonuclease I [Pseudomonadota bacterium]